MKTFKEILDEELAIAGALDEEAQEYLLHLYPQIERASIRFVNQETQDLQSKILHYRREFCPSHEVGWYDQFFGITNERVGE
jgi:hypothetical protein